MKFDVYFKSKEDGEIYIGTIEADNAEKAKNHLLDVCCFEESTFIIKAANN
jgi:hypothetical protein